MSDGNVAVIGLQEKGSGEVTFEQRPESEKQQVIQLSREDASQAYMVKGSKGGSTLQPEAQGRARNLRS